MAYYRIIYGITNLTESANLGCIAFDKDDSFGSWIPDDLSRPSAFLDWPTDSMREVVQMTIDRYRDYPFEERKSKHVHYMSSIQVRESCGTIRQLPMDELARDIGERFTGS